MGKSTINGTFSMAMLNNERVYAAFAAQFVEDGQQLQDFLRQISQRQRISVRDWWEVV